MRIHGLACCYVLFFAWKTEVGGGELAVLLLAMGLVTAAEAMNTSIERLCDFVEKRHVRQIGMIKDLAAGAVLLSAAFAAMAGVAILFSPKRWALLWGLAESPWRLVAFIASLIFSGLLIFLVPLRKE